MGKGDWDGYETAVRGLSPDWERFVGTLADALGSVRSVSAPPPLAGSDWYGSSANFDLELRRDYPHLRVPEGSIVPLTERPFWVPADETPDPSGPCPKCGGGIEPGSDTYCPKCHASGYETRLARQRGMAGTPPPEPPPRQPPGPRVGAKAGPKARKARRAAKGSGHEGDA